MSHYQVQSCTLSGEQSVTREKQYTGVYSKYDLVPSLPEEKLYKINQRRRVNLSKLKEKERTFKAEKHFFHREAVKTNILNKYITKYVQKYPHEISEITPEYIYNKLLLFVSNCSEYIRNAFKYDLDHRSKKNHVRMIPCCSNKEVDQEIDDLSVTDINASLPFKIMQEDVDIDTDDQYYSTTLVIEHYEFGDGYSVDKKARLVKNKKGLYYAIISYKLLNKNQQNDKILNVEEVKKAREVKKYIVQQVSAFRIKCYSLDYATDYQKVSNSYNITLYLDESDK